MDSRRAPLRKAFESRLNGAVSESSAAAGSGSGSAGHLLVPTNSDTSHSLTEFPVAEMRDFPSGESFTS
jgi:hypothetical protein